MSVYNGQAFLAEAVESILGQTFRDFEFVIIDDGSSDRTPKILARYVALDDRIRVCRHENRGRAESLNVGIELARGKYIARMDADDVALSDRLKQQLDFLERHREVGLLGGGVELVDPNGQTLKTIQPPLEDSEIRRLLLQSNPMYHPTVLMRKQVVLASGGYRKALLDADDYDLWLRMSERSRLANIGHPVLRYRIHHDQVSIRNMRHQTMCVLAASAAASLRRSGSPDPLMNVEVVTPQFLDTIGVSEEQIQRALLGVYIHWEHVLKLVDAESALRAVEGILQLSGSGLVERSILANAWLTAATLHYRLGRPVKALASAGRAVLTRPIIAGRPVKRALTRLAAALRN